MVDSEENLIKDVLENIRHDMSLLVSVECKDGVVKQPVQQWHHSTIEQQNAAHKDQAVEDEALRCPCSNFL